MATDKMKDDKAAVQQPADQNLVNETSAVAFGSGLSWAGAVVKLGVAGFAPVGEPEYAEVA